jgi:hypothetical protein
MGIKHLFQLIKEEAPLSIREGEIKQHFGRKVAIVGQLLQPFPYNSADNGATRMRTIPFLFSLELHPN